MMNGMVKNGWREANAPEDDVGGSSSEGKFSDQNLNSYCDPHASLCGMESRALNAEGRWGCLWIWAPEPTILGASGE